MKKTLLKLFLLALMGLAGNHVTAMAQIPDPAGQWTFNNPDDLMESTK